MKLLCASILLCVVVAANAVQYIDCGSKLCKINSVNVSGCAADAQTCDLVRGKTVNLTMQFTTLQALDSTIQNELEGEVAHIWVPFSTTDACSEMTPGCPLKANVMATFVYSLDISDKYPKILVPIKSEMKEKSGSVCTCFEMQGKIV